MFRYTWSMESGISDTVRENFVGAVASQLAGKRYRLFLFGLRAKNTGSIRSDYDLAIDAGSAIDLVTINRIREQLDVIPIMQKIDLLDLRSVSREFSDAISGELVVLDER